ncbi:MAG: universal stress protein [Nocardioides sp.]|jgi:nucleotide-binding universal stress UspA family protein
MTNELTGSVVLGVDGTPGSAGAMRYAVAEARRTGAELRLVHVSPGYTTMPAMPSVPLEIAAVGAEILERARADVREIDAELTVSTTRRTGSRIRELVDSSRDSRVLVLGHETRGPVERFIGGGTTASVAAHALVPVLVIPSDWEPETDRGPVVVGLKSRAHAEELLAAAFHRAAAAGAPIHVLHAWQLPDQYIDRIEARANGEYWLTRGSELVEEVLAPWREDYPDVPVTVSVVHGDPARALVHAARDARLLVLVRRAPGRVLGSHLGGTGRALLRAVSCPVEVVPGTNVVPDTPGLELEESGALLR